jgi:Holliday junction resolvase RusA-like endonuclease
MSSFSRRTPVVTAIAFTLPLPPSANGLFLNLKGGGRAKTQAYKAWREEAAWHVKQAWRQQGKPEIADQPMRLEVDLGLCGRTRDAGNCLKAIEDLLVWALPVPDDRWNDEITIRRSVAADGLARVRLEPLNST